MPIKACADKLRHEVTTYGAPPVMPEEAAPNVEEAAVVDPTKFKATKGKATAKKGKGATQWDILKSSGIEESEIPRFQCATSLLALIAAFMLIIRPTNSKEWPDTTIPYHICIPLDGMIYYYHLWRRNVIYYHLN